MLTGRTPFEAEDLLTLLRMKVEQTAPNLSETETGREFPQELESLVAKMLEKDPAARYQTMKEMLNILSEIKVDRSKEEQDLPRSSGTTPEKTSIIPGLVVFLFILAFTSFAYFNIPKQEEVLPVAPPTEVQILNERMNAMRIRCQRVSNPNREEHPAEKWYQILKDQPISSEDFKTLSIFLSNIAESKREDKNYEMDHTRLILQERHITGEDLAVLQENDISALDLTKCTFDNTIFDVLPLLPKLEILLLEGTSINNEQLKTLWKLKMLEELNLSNCDKISAPGFEEIEKSPRLKVIWLSRTANTKDVTRDENHPNQKIGFEVMKRLAASKSLEKIHAANTSTDDRSIEALLSSPARVKKHFLEFNLSSCRNITGRTMQLIAEKDPTIEGLAIAHTSIEAGDLEYLGKMTNLKYLNVMGIDIDSKSLKIIGGLAKLKSLYINDLIGTDSDLNYLYKFKDPEAIFIFNATGISSAAFKEMEKHYHAKNKNFRLVSPLSERGKEIEDVGRILENMPF